MDLLQPQRLGDDAFSRTNGSYGSGPLAARISHVLSASYSDVEFSQTLLLLDESSLKNDAVIRRQIRLQAERRVIEYNGAALDKFERVAQQLRRLNTIREQVNGLYHATRQSVGPAHQRTQPHLEDAIALLQRRHRLQVKQSVLAVVNQRFVMSGDLIAKLTSSAHPVDDTFFQALGKVEQIRRDCELLLGFENQTLGSDLMEQTSANLNLAFQKLHKWLQRQFKALNIESAQINSTVRHALRVLAERPSLFRSCLSLFSESRERTLSNAFHAALTGTTGSGIGDLSVKPIDLVAHDSLRYVGDMLAWVHSATVSEREALEVLFLAEGQEPDQRFQAGHVENFWCRMADSKGNDGHDGNNHLESSNVFNPLLALNELVDQNIKGACQLLRQRVEQVIRSSEESIAAYKLAALIAFYYMTFVKLLGHKAHLPYCLRVLEREAFLQFRALVRDRVTVLKAEHREPSADLSTPDFLNESLRQLEAIIKTYESSISTSKDAAEDSQNLLAEAFEPFMSECVNMSHSLDLLDDAIFITNCKLEAVKTLGAFKITSVRSYHLRDDIADQTTRMIDLQHDFLCKASGLSSLFSIIKSTSTEIVLDKDVLEKATEQLDNFLPSALMDALERLAKLRDSALGRQITQAAAELFCNDFQALKEAIKTLNNRMGSSSLELYSAFPRTISEIRVLLL